MLLTLGTFFTFSRRFDTRLVRLGLEALNGLVIARGLWNVSALQDFSPVHPSRAYRCKKCPHAPKASQANGFAWGQGVGTIKFVPFLVR